MNLLQIIEAKDLNEIDAGSSNDLLLFCTCCISESIVEIIDYWKNHHNPTLYIKCKSCSSTGCINNANIYLTWNPKGIPNPVIIKRRIVLDTVDIFIRSDPTESFIINKDEVNNFLQNIFLLQ